MVSRLLAMTSLLTHVIGRRTVCPILLQLTGDFIHLLICESFQVNQAIPSAARPDQLVELQMKSPRVSVLGVLKKEDREEGEDGGSRIDDQLPGLGETEEWA